jgi:hypothetical protein
MKYVRRVSQFLLTHEWIIKIQGHRRSHGTWKFFKHWIYFVRKKHITSSGQSLSIALLHRLRSKPSDDLVDGHLEPSSEAHEACHSGRWVRGSFRFKWSTRDETKAIRIRPNDLISTLPDQSWSKAASAQECSASPFDDLPFFWRRKNR